MGEILASVAGGLGQGLVQGQELAMKRDYYAALKKQADQNIKVAELEAQAKLQQAAQSGELMKVVQERLGGMGKPPAMRYGGQPSQLQPGNQAGAGGVKIPPQFAQDVARASLESGTPSNILAAVIDTESSWNPQAVGSSGEKGLGQFMPGTAQQVGLSDPFAPRDAIQATAKHLAALKESTGSWPLAFAAYNAGLGAVQKHGGIPPYPVTQNYVQNVTQKAGLPMELAQAQTQQEFPQGQQGGENPFDDPMFAAAWQLATGKSVTGAMQSDVKLEKIDTGDKVMILPFGRDGRQIGPAQTFKKTPELQPFKLPVPGGGEKTIMIDPRNPPKELRSDGGSGGGIPGGVVTKNPEGVPQADAGRMQMAQTGLEALSEFTKIIYDEKGSIKRWPLINKQLGEGRRVDSLVFSIIDPIIRAATGAGMPQQEMDRYLAAYTPKALDDQVTIESKMRRLESYLNGYLEKLDPTGQLRARVGPQQQSPQPTKGQPAATLPPEALGHLREKIPAQFKIDGEIQTWILENGQQKRIK